MARRSRGSILWREDRAAYYARWVGHDGQRHKVLGGTTIEEAEAELARRLDDDDRRARGQTLERSLAEFLADSHSRVLAARLEKKAFQTRRGRLRRVAKILRGKPMADVTPNDAERIIAKLAHRKKPPKPGTLAAYKSALVVCWDAAIAAGAAAENPWKRVKLPRAQEFAVPFLDEWALARIYRRVRPRYRPFVTFLGETGMRRGAALALRWSAVAPDYTSVSVRGKGGRVTSVPLTTAARDLLEQLHRRRGAVAMHGGDRVFAMVGVTWPKWAREAWRSAAKKAGWPKLRLHDLRHARASLLVRAGVPLPTVAAWLGHSSIELVARRYGHHQPEDALRRALQVLESSRRRGPRAASGGSASGSRRAQPAASPSGRGRSRSARGA
jgi:integrase